MRSKTAILASTALASFVPAVAGGGGFAEAIVKNKCSEPVYLWSVADLFGVEMVTIKPGGQYSEPYQLNPNGGGISIKLSLTPSRDGVTQFEYTLADPTIFYDISNIDGYPFLKWGVSLTPSDKSCPVVVCDPGVALCKEAYNQPYDDWATKGCPATSDLTMVLCIGKPDPPPGNPSPSGHVGTLKYKAKGKGHLHKRHHKHE